MRTHTRIEDHMTEEVVITFWGLGPNPFLRGQMVKLQDGSVLRIQTEKPLINVVEYRDVFDDSKSETILRQTYFSKWLRQPSKQQNCI